MAKKPAAKAASDAPFEAGSATATSRVGRGIPVEDGDAAPATAKAKGAKADARPAGRGAGKAAGRSSARRGSRQSYTSGSAKGKDLVIVESPAKAKTINKYLGGKYVVLASIGHIRDLPSKNPKGVKSPVPGVDLEQKFKPTYEVLEGKDNVVNDLKRAAKDARSTGGNVWFATDLDREGEAIAWHLAHLLEIEPAEAKRVIFAAITKGEIEKAFNNPHPIDEDRVNAQQARRILDRIVGYQVSPLLWKKVARGLSAGRVQSVAVRLIVEREREIRAFIPDEYWALDADFVLSEAEARKLAPEFAAFMARKDDKGNPPTLKMQNTWMGDNNAIRAELVEVGGDKFEVRSDGASKRLSDEERVNRVLEIARLAGMREVRSERRENPDGKGPARVLRTVTGTIDPATPYAIVSLETKRTSSRPYPPFITSTMQQSAASRLGFGAQRTMRAAQQLYEGVEIPGEGPVGLITYMRTDSTHISGEALTAVRAYIGRAHGEKYLPEKPNFFSSSNKAAQEAHEAIRPTSFEYPPSRVRAALSPDQFRLYELIWNRFVACQMTPAQWDSTTALIKGGTDPRTPLTFKATGRVLVFDGFYKVAGIPSGGDEQNLPALREKQPMHAFAAQVEQKFTSPPARYSEASLIKTLEAEGIGRPSTYASIISVIEERKYVEKLQGRFFATDLGEVVTDKLIEAIPQIIDVGYTREMEKELDQVEEEHLDWIKMLQDFYGPFKKALIDAEATLKHAKAETVPAPKEYTCPTCEKEGRGKSPLVYRFGKNGRFLSCSLYPTCNYASPCDRDGKPRPAAEAVNVACPKCGSAMTKRTGRFGEFLSCTRYGDKTNPCDGILNADKKTRKIKAPSQPALITDLPCPTCESPLNLRDGLKGPWLGCSRFPKCRGRGKWAELPEAKRAELEKALAENHKAHPIPIIRTLDGKPLTDSTGKPLKDAPTIDQLGGSLASASETDAPTNEAVEQGIEEPV
jgi:DNA topoisomerase-1